MSPGLCYILPLNPKILRLLRLQQQAAVEEEGEGEEGGGAGGGEEGRKWKRGGRGNHKDGNGSTAPCARRMMTMTAATSTGRDRDCPAEGKSDLCDNGASKRYQSGCGGGTQDGRGGGSGNGEGRGGGNSNGQNGGGGNTKIEENLRQ
jgi:hypothetical protein